MRAVKHDPDLRDTAPPAERQRFESLLPIRQRVRCNQRAVKAVDVTVVSMLSSFAPNTRMPSVVFEMMGWNIAPV